MKLLVTYIRCISLLFVGGLILTLYINMPHPANKAEKHVAEKNNLRSTHSKSPSMPFLLLNDVVGAFFPALKNQINL